LSVVIFGDKTPLGCGRRVRLLRQRRFDDLRRRHIFFVCQRKVIDVESRFFDRRRFAGCALQMRIVFAEVAVMQRRQFVVFAELERGSEVLVKGQRCMVFGIERGEFAFVESRRRAARGVRRLP
jgi:hypothetical protein